MKRIDFGAQYVEAPANAIPIAFINVEEIESLTLAITLKRVAATAVGIAISYSLDGGKTYATLQAATVAGVLTDLAFSKALATNGVFGFTLPVQDYTHVKVAVSTTAGGATDLLTLVARGSVSDLH